MKRTYCITVIDGILHDLLYRRVSFMTLDWTIGL